MRMQFSVRSFYAVDYVVVVVRRRVAAAAAVVDCRQVHINYIDVFVANCT